MAIGGSGGRPARMKTLLMNVACAPSESERIAPATVTRLPCSVTEDSGSTAMREQTVR